MSERLEERAPLRVTLESGLKTRLRPLGPEDIRRVQEAWHLLSDESKRNRYWNRQNEMSEELASALVTTDSANHLAWIALHESDDDFPGYGGASLWRDEENPESAEITFTIGDTWQREGLASLFFSLLWFEGWQIGIREITGVARPRNAAIRDWWDSLGGELSIRSGHLHFRFPLEAPEMFRQRVAYEMPPSSRRVAVAEWLQEWESVSSSS
ncbi:MAG: GNAT family N-acetyltransferase [Verrucomicrobiota bacterium]